MIDSLSEVESSILDVKIELESLDTELQNLHWENLDRISDRFSDISGEIDGLVGLFDDFNTVDDNGNWSKEAISHLALLSQKYELAKYQVSQYGDEINKLNEDYLNGKYSLLEYQEKLAELSQEQWSAIDVVQSTEDAIVSLNETRIDEVVSGIEKEIYAYEELIQAQIDALDAEKDLHDYRKSIEETTKSKTDIERQLIAIANDDSQSAKAQKAKLQAELAEINAELEEKEYDHSIEQQRSALETQLDDFRQQKDSEIEILQNSLDNEEALIAQSFETVKQNASLVGEQITQIAQQHGVYVSDALTSSWNYGENAIASYGTVLSAESSAFIGNIIGVENEVWDLQAQANMTADSLAWMFATRADNLVYQLEASRYSEENLNAMTNALQQSLVNTLERGYNVSSITSALDSIASSADNVAESASRAAQALADMGAAQTGTYKIGLNGRAVTGLMSEKEADEWLKKNNSSGYYYKISGYATGGIITKDDNNPLNNIAKAVGEDVIIAAKDHESILTPKQTEALMNLTPMLDNFSNLWNVPIVNTKIPEMVRNVNNAPKLEFNGTLMHIDKVDSTNIKQMEFIANKAVDNLVNKMSNGIKYGRF